VVNEAVYGRERHGLAGKDLTPFAEGLVGGDEHGSALVACADQFEQNARFRLILGDIGEIVEDQKVIFVEFGDRGFEGEIAASDLKFLDEVGGSGEEDAPALFDQRQTERRREMGFSSAWQDRDVAPAFWRVKRQSSIRFTRLRGGRWPPQGGAFSTRASSTSRSF
jgi:hypothetical protein